MGSLSQKYTWRNKCKWNIYQLSIATVSTRSEVRLIFQKNFVISLRVSLSECSIFTEISILADKVCTQFYRNWSYLPSEWEQIKTIHMQCAVHMYWIRNHIHIQMNMLQVNVPKMNKAEWSESLMQPTSCVNYANVYSTDGSTELSTSFNKWLLLQNGWGFFEIWFRCIWDNSFERKQTFVPKWTCY